MKSVMKFSAISLLAAAVAVLPLSLSAQTNSTNVVTKKVAVHKTATGEKNPSDGPFRGKLAAVDKVAKTITVGSRTIQITSQTKIFKSGKPGTLDDAVVGEMTGGYQKVSSDGKYNATTVNFGPKAEARPLTKKTEKAPDKEEKPAPGTNTAK